MNASTAFLHCSWIFEPESIQYIQLSLIRDDAFCDIIYGYACLTYINPEIHSTCRQSLLTNHRFSSEHQTNCAVTESACFCMTNVCVHFSMRWLQEYLRCLICSRVNNLAYTMRVVTVYTHIRILSSDISPLRTRSVYRHTDCKSRTHCVTIINRRRENQQPHAFASCSCHYRLFIYAVA